MAVVLLPALALADDQRTVERVVKAHIGGLATRDKDDKLGLAKDVLATVFGTDVRADIASARGGAAGTAQATVQTVSVGVDGEHGVAWFQGQFKVDVVPKGTMRGDPSLFHTVERAGGVIVLGKDGWKIAGVEYGRMIEDPQLAQLGKEHGDALPGGEPKLTGDKGLDGVVATWIKTGLVAHAATDATLIASGTAATEWGTDDAAKALVKGWDPLKLRASSIDSRTYADGAAGYARVKVIMPTKAGFVELALGLVAIWQENEWRWVSLELNGTHF